MRQLRRLSAGFPGLIRSRRHGHDYRARAMRGTDRDRAHRRARPRLRSGVVAVALGLVVLAPLPALAHPGGRRFPSPGERTGLASYYGPRHQGRLTASGQRFNDRALTAASPTLPFGTRVRVTVLATGRSVVVTITDRMPGHRRLLDLSRRAARDLGILRRGVMMVAIRPIPSLLPR